MYVNIPIDIKYPRGGGVAGSWVMGPGVAHPRSMGIDRDARR